MLWKGAQHPQEGSNLLQMTQGILASLFLQIAIEINVENILEAL